MVVGIKGISFHLNLLIEFSTYGVAVTKSDKLNFILLSRNRGLVDWEWEQREVRGQTRRRRGRGKCNASF